MKLGKLLTIASTLFLLTGVVTSCDSTNPTSTVTDGVTAEHLAGAKDYLKDLYKGTYVAGKATTATYQLVSKVTYQNVTFDVTWRVEIKEDGLSEAVKVGTKDERYTTIEVKYDSEYSTKDTTYDLVATLTSGNQTGEVKFVDLKVPTFKGLTIAEFIELGDTANPVAIQGVVSAVNSLTEKNSFTLTDSTGSIFCYDKDLQLKLGDEVIITGTFSLYSSKFPQLTKPSLVKVVASDRLDSIASTMTTYTISDIKNGLEEFDKDNKSLSMKYLKITGGIVASNSGNACLKINYLDASYVVSLYYHSASSLLSEHLADEITVIGVVRGIYQDKNITLQVQTYEVTKDNEPPVAVAEPAVEHTTIAALATTKPTENNKKIYVVEGTFTEKDGGAGKYGNGTISDGTNTLTVYGLASSKEAAKVKWDEYAASYSYTNPQDFASTGIQSGDTVKLGMLYSLENDRYTTFVWTEPTTPEEVNGVQLTAETLLDYSGKDVAYSAEAKTKEVNGVTFSYTQIGAFKNSGGVLQMKDKDGKTSLLSNTTATTKAIKDIKLVYASNQKRDYENDGVIFKFGNDTTVASCSTRLVLTKDTYEFTVTPDAATYTFFYLEQDFGYAAYWASITINYVD